MKYVVAGNAVADCINYADGSSAGFRPGGATLFALTGIQLWTDDVLLCGGFGEDYMQQLGDYLERNHIDRRGFNVRDPHHPINYMYYRDEGGWDTKTVHGFAHYDRLCCNPEEDGLRRFLTDARAVTTFRGEDPAFFREMFALQEEFGFRFGWEIRGSMCVPEKLPLIRQLLERVDAFSLNGPEAYTLFGVDSDQAAIDALLALHVPLVIFRVGKRGLYVLKDGEVLFAPSFEQYPVVDVTGCGNTSTASGFYAFWEGMDIYDIAAYANVASAHNLRVYGAMDLGPAQRAEALADAAAFSRQLRATQTVQRGTQG